MAYKIRIEHTPFDNKATVGYIERLRWKKKKFAERYRNAYVPTAEIVKS